MLPSEIVHRPIEDYQLDILTASVGIAQEVKVAEDQQRKAQAMQRRGRRR